MSDANDDQQTQPPDPAATNLGALNPGELLARGMHSVKMSAGSGAAWTPPTVAEVAHLFPNYEVLAMIGHGGMGAVYKAKQVALDRMVAIKLLPLEISIDKDFADRFVREARAMAKLNHPNIIAVYDFGKTSEGHLFFVMEFVEGANLHEIIHAEGLNPEQALSLAAQVCAALAYAHGKGVVHRDIKPANVMVDTESHVKVADFGLARLTDPNAEQWGTTMTGVVMGTPDYMAPEQKRGMNVDHRADIYSLGVMLYEMLCREIPQGVFDPPSHRVACDTRVDAIVMRAMAREPDRRFQHTTEMKAAVDAARTPLPKPEPIHVPAPEPALQAASQPARKNRAPLWIASAVALAALAGAAFFISKNRVKDAGATATTTDGATIATATKDAPFVNTLGMKFVPVPGTQVLFSVWDTRGQDYAAYAQANPNVDGSWKWQEQDGVPIGREPAHPVVGVSWEDAQAFCQWLTAKETAAGKLPAGAKYRLPTDEEWSWAAGMPPEQGATPAEKHQKDSVNYPWGTGYPPPKEKVGNYADTAYHDKFPTQKWIGNYTDGVATTSPVGSFPVNALGLYDMGGNVWQWCEDSFDKSQRERVLRGGSWVSYGIGALLSSNRNHSLPTLHSPFDGFRCVLAPAEPPAAALEPGAIKLWDSPEKIPQHVGSRWEDNAMRLDATSVKYFETLGRDAMIRAEIRMNPDRSDPQVCLRYQANELGGNYYRLVVKSKEGVAILASVHLGKTTEIGSWHLPRTYDPDEWLRLELRAIGDAVTVAADGKTLGTVHDTSQPEAGGVQLFATAAGYFRNVVYVPLDRVDGVKPASPSMPPRNEWITLLGTPEAVGRSSAEDLELKNGWLIFQDRINLLKEAGEKTDTVRNASVRATVRPPTNGHQIVFELRNGASGQYNLEISQDRLVLRKITMTSPTAERDYRVLRDLPLILPKTGDRAFKVECSLQEDAIRVTVDGNKVIEMADAAFTRAGKWVLAQPNGANRTGMVKDLAIKLLGDNNRAPAIAYPPGQWVKPYPDLQKLGDLATYDQGWAARKAEAPGVRIPATGGGDLQLRNGGVRARFRLTTAGQRSAPTFLIRIKEHRLQGELSFSRSTGDDTGTLLINLVHEDGKKIVSLAKAPMQKPVRQGEEYTMEFYAVGSLLIGRLNGQTLTAKLDDSMNLDAGHIGMGGADRQPFRDFEVINLDGLPEAEALRILGVDEKGNDLRGKTAPAAPSLKLSASYPKPAEWIDATNEVGRKMVDSKAAVFEGDSLRFIKGGVFPVADGREFHNAVVRIGCMHNATIFLRQRDKTRYVAQAGSTGAGNIMFFDTAQNASLPLKRADGIPAPDFDPNAEHELVFAVQDDRLTVWLDGVEKATMRDSTLARGAIGVQINTDSAALGNVRVRKVEYAELPESVAPVSSSATATKDAPFVNSFGMKFVPVPITGGPTDGQHVLFSVWDTRVQDYAAFVKEEWRERPKPDFEQGPTHPAINVSWEDAQAFCLWLTVHERRANRLGTNYVYRLPTDHEWSCAVGIGDKEDAAKLPAEKAQKIGDAFPWGTQWPPPKGAGNYAGEELQPALAAGKFSYVKGVIAGYNDGFVNTSPVGSFAANRFGLYDMGGNVRQWCEDWYDKEQKDRVLRGAAWTVNDRNNLLSSSRHPYVPTNRYYSYGFRCVLAPVAHTPPAAAVPSPAPAK